MGQTLDAIDSSLVPLPKIVHFFAVAIDHILWTLYLVSNQLFLAFLIYFNWFPIKFKLFSDAIIAVTKMALLLWVKKPV